MQVECISSLSSDTGQDADKKEPASEKRCRLLACRDDQTRTGDPCVPNAVRYQLRYIPNCVCKITTYFGNMQ